MKRILSITFFGVMLACTEQRAESDSNKSNSVAPKIDSVKLKEAWEYEMEMLEKESVEKREDFNATMQKKSFRFTCYDQCDDESGIEYEEMKRYGVGKPYDIENKIKDDTLIIRFKFIASCCLEYIGDVEKRNDSLLLSYKNISFTPCDCRCHYYYMFSLPVEKYKSKCIVLNNVRI